jgi:succinyl-CoA synthetase alpha subunit
MKNLKTSNLDRVLKILDGNTRGFKSPTKSIAELLDEIDQQVAVITEDSNEAHAAACQAYCFDQELALIESGVSIEDAVLMVDLDVLQAVGI